MGTTTGFRISDLLRIQPQNIKRGGRIRIKQKKTGKIKEVKLDPLILRLIRSLCSRYSLMPSDYLFFRSRKRHDVSMSRQWARTVIARIASEMGLISIGSHSMRKTYACDLYRSTRSVEAVREALTHGKKEVTLIYLKDVLK